MVTLTYASITARKSIRYTIYFIIFLIIGRMLLNVGVSIYKKIFPPAPEPATVAFGKLPQLTFPEQEHQDINFILETANNELPTLPDKANVYFMPKVSANLLSLDVAKDTAKKLGYNSDPQQLSDSVYRFSHKTSNATLEMNIISKAFSISFDLNADPSVISKHPSQPETALSQVKSFLESANLLTGDLSSKYKYKYLKTQGGNFIPVSSLSDASIIRIDLFRDDYNQTPVVNKIYNEANIWFIVSGIKEKGRDIIAGEYHYFPVDATKFATYPVKSSQVLWQELNNKNYYLASNSNNNEDQNLKIRKIYLAYYDSGDYSQFLQPVVVFEGDNNFVAYIPAITNNYQE